MTFIDYEKIHENLGFPAVFLLLGLLVLWFIFLATIADTLFVPNLSTVKFIYQIKESVAGVTIVAFANGAADIFSTLIAFDTGNAKLAIGELMGATLFVSIFTTGLISIFYPVSIPQPLLAIDLVFFILAMIIWGVYISYRTITVFACLFLFILYLLYVAFVVFVSWEAEVQTSPTSAQIISHTPTNVPNRRLPNGTEYLSATPSETSLLLEPDFDVNYFQPDLHIRHSFSELPSSVTAGSSNVRNANYISLRRVSNISNSPHTVNPENSEINEDILNYTMVDLEQTNFNWNVELKYCWQHLFPIVELWESLHPIEKIGSLIQSPFIFLLNLTVPVIHERHLQTRAEYSTIALNEEIILATETHENEADYPKLLLYLQLFTSPFLVSTLTGVISSSLLEIPVVVHCFVIGSILSFTGFFLTQNKMVIDYAVILTIFGFVESILYISVVTRELVDLLAVLGSVFNIRSSVMGLTLFAAGNSVPDLVGNLTMCRKGSRTMALSACIGGPVLNVIMGTSLGAFYYLIKNGDSVEFTKMSTSFWISYGGLILCLTISLLSQIYYKFEIKSSYGILLLILYVTTVTISVLSEVIY